MVQGTHTRLQALQRYSTNHLAKSIQPFAFLFFCQIYIDYDATKPKTEDSYAYYVHFENLDKRNDDWIPFSRIRKTKEKID